LDRSEPTTAGILVYRKPLPRRPAPYQDELLSSWIARLANANFCSVPELCRYLEIGQDRPPETQSDLAGVRIDSFCATSRLPPLQIGSTLLQRQTDFTVGFSELPGMRA